MGRATFQRKAEEHEMSSSGLPPSAPLLKGSPTGRLDAFHHDGTRPRRLWPWGGLAVRELD